LFSSCACACVWSLSLHSFFPSSARVSMSVSSVSIGLSLCVWCGRVREPRKLQLQWVPACLPTWPGLAHLLCRNLKASSQTGRSSFSTPLFVTRQLLSFSLACVVCVRVCSCGGGKANRWVTFSVAEHGFDKAKVGRCWHAPWLALLNPCSATWNLTSRTTFVVSHPSVHMDVSAQAGHQGVIFFAEVASSPRWQHNPVLTDGE